MPGGSVITSFGSQNKYTVKPPEKGSFPIDHEGECKLYMKSFLTCLRENKNESSKCRPQSKDYLSCRMDKNLMERDTWKKLGYADLAASER